MYASTKTTRGSSRKLLRNSIFPICPFKFPFFLEQNFHFRGFFGLLLKQQDPTVFSSELSSSESLLIYRIGKSALESQRSVLSFHNLIITSIYHRQHIR